MSQPFADSFTHTVEYKYIELALQARWNSFSELNRDFQTFKPLPVEAFHEARTAEFSRLKGLNPHWADTDLGAFVDVQIDHRADKNSQIHAHFGSRVMAEYVTVALLSHALVESAINAILAVGLGTSDRAELFELIERSEVKRKWLVGPKVFEPAYRFETGGLMYQTLDRLTKHRNLLVHHKISLDVGGKPQLTGRSLEPTTLDDYLLSIRRYFTLPYALCHMLRTQVPSFPGLILYDAGPIELVNMH